MSEHVGGGRMPCQVLKGIEDGFCGAFATVFTFLAELQTLQRPKTYMFGVATISGGLIMVVAVMGGVRWGLGWSEGNCMI